MKCRVHGIKHVMAFSILPCGCRRKFCVVYPSFEGWKKVKVKKICKKVRSCESWKTCKALGGN